MMWDLLFIKKYKYVTNLLNLLFLLISDDEITQLGHSSEDISKQEVVWRYERLMNSQSRLETWLHGGDNSIMREERKLGDRGRSDPESGDSSAVPEDILNVLGDILAVLGNILAVLGEQV